MLDTNESNPLPPQCVGARQTLADLGLGDSLRREVAAGLAHLEVCPGCQCALREYDLIAEALVPQSSASEEPEPAGGWSAVHDRWIAALPQNSRGRLSISRWVRPSIAIAAAVLLAVGGFAMGNRRAAQMARISEEPRAMFTSLPAEEVARQVRAFDEVNLVFEGRTRWLLLSAT